MDNIFVYDKSLFYLLINENYTSKTLVRRSKYLLSISNNFIIYKDIIIKRISKEINTYNKIYKDIDSMGDMLPLEIRYLIMEKAYYND